MNTIYINEYASPVGIMLIGAHNGRICLCDWAQNKRRATINQRLRLRLDAHFAYGASSIIDTTIEQLNAYFAGEHFNFNIPLTFTGTDFQERVWHELCRIPYASTISYAELARRINQPTAIRAVASANANNPISILVPCHRVINSNGQLGGYAAGCNVKRHLLSLEINSVKPHSQTKPALYY